MSDLPAINFRLRGVVVVVVFVVGVGAGAAAGRAGALAALDDTKRQRGTTLRSINIIVVVAFFFLFETWRHWLPSYKSNWLVRTGDRGRSASMSLCDGNSSEPPSRTNASLYVPALKFDVDSRLPSVTHPSRML